jgi:hypothetical protein
MAAAITLGEMERSDKEPTGQARTLPWRCAARLVFDTAAFQRRCGEEREMLSVSAAIGVEKPTATTGKVMSYFETQLNCFKTPDKQNAGGPAASLRGNILGVYFSPETVYPSNA